MVWLQGLFLVVIVICQFYVMGFQSSEEGKDERGREIQYKTNNTLYKLMYLGMILLIVLNVTGIIPTSLLPNILLYFTLVLSVFGSVFIYINKRQKNY